MNFPSYKTLNNAKCWENAAVSFDVDQVYTLSFSADVDSESQQKRPQILYEFRCHLESILKALQLTDKPTSLT